MILLVAFPVSSDVPGVAHRQEMKIGCIPQLVTDLEGGGLLTFDSNGVDAVNHFDFASLAQFADDAQRGVKVSLDRDGDGAVHQCLSEFTGGDFAVREEHYTFHSGAG